MRKIMHLGLLGLGLLLASCSAADDSADACSGNCQGEDSYVGGEDTGTPLEGTVTGNLSFELLLPAATDGGLELSDKTTIPADGMLALYVDSEGNMLGAAQVDANGDYAIQGSREPQAGDMVAFTTLWAPSIQSNDVRLVVAAPMEGGDPDTLTDSKLWVWSSAVPLDGDVGELTITENDGSGAVFIFLLSKLAMETLMTDVMGGEDLLSGLAILWAPGTEWSCGACFSAYIPQTVAGSTFDNSIFVGGEEGGSSAWGYTVILHEFGHYVAKRYFRDDSPGGSHNLGTKIVPPFAWSEGFASFFAVSTFSRWAGEPQPLYWDIQNSSSFWIDYGALEYDSGSILMPTASGGITQNLDENYVGAVIWDLWDGDDMAESEEPADGTALGTYGFLVSLINDRFYYGDRGAEGADLIDFVDSASCQFPDLAGDISETLTDHLSFPYDDNATCE